MTNNNLADISVFESIQSKQHRTSISSMSVFSSSEDVQLLERVSGSYIVLLDKLFAAYNQKQVSKQKYEQAKKEYEDDEKEWDRAAVVANAGLKTYENTLASVRKSRNAEAIAITKMDVQERKLAESAYLKEEKEIAKIQDKVCIKENRIW